MIEIVRGVGCQERIIDVMRWARMRRIEAKIVDEPSGTADLVYSTQFYGGKTLIDDPVPGTYDPNMVVARSDAEAALNVPLLPLPCRVTVKPDVVVLDPSNNPDRVAGIARNRYRDATLVTYDIWHADYLSHKTGMCVGLVDNYIREAATIITMAEEINMGILTAWTHGARIVGGKVLYKYFGFANSIICGFNVGLVGSHVMLFVKTMDMIWDWARGGDVYMKYNDSKVFMPQRIRA